jgi:hypothetical protein
MLFKQQAASSKQQPRQSGTRTNETNETAVSRQNRATFPDIFIVRFLFVP